MRTLGIDLAVRAEHRAVVADERGEYVTAVVPFRTAPVEMDRLLAQARASAPGCELQAVMEATAMSWFPVAVYLHRQGVRVYVVNCQQVADLRRYYKRHAKSDRIDARRRWRACRWSTPISCTRCPWPQPARSPASAAVGNWTAWPNTSRPA